MNLFQWITVPLLLALLLVELVGVLRRRGLGAGRMLRCVVWSAAAVAIARPELSQTVADMVGIHRGVDLVIYLFMLVFLMVSFYFYARCLRLQRQLTEIVRHLAIQEARRGGEGQP